MFENINTSENRCSYVFAMYQEVFSNSAAVSKKHFVRRSVRPQVGRYVANAQHFVLLLEKISHSTGNFIQY